MAQKFWESTLDPTKQVDFDVESLSPATTRTITMPDRSGTLFDAASNAVTATGNLTSTNVQAALEEHQADLDLLEQGLVYQGDWDASSGSFPGGGAAQTGWFYKVGTAGTVDGVDFAVGDSLYAATDNASTTTFAGNWNQIGSAEAISTVFGRTGAVTAQAGDYNAGQITFTPAGDIAATDVQAALAELDTEKVAANITEGTLPAAAAARTVDMGTNDLTFSNVGALDIDAATIGMTIGGSAAYSFDAARQMTLGAYTGATFDAAPTKSLGVDASGNVVTFAPGSGTTNLTVGGVTATTLDVESSTGTNATLPTATGTDAGVMPAADKVKMDFISVTGAVDLDTMLPNTLASGSIFVGDAGGEAAAVAMSGDVTIDNAGATTVVSASDTAAGKVELATAAETAAQTDGTRAVTPLSLAGLIMDTAVNQTYTESNVTTNRTIDADAVTMQQLADVVGSLLGDLRTKGIID